MDFNVATYDELRKTRDAIELRLRDLEREALADIEKKAREFGFKLNGSVEPKKERRKRRTKAEIEADNAKVTQ